jgi:methylated-DNA-[protein]-cysteine S-methyltransferase
MSQSHTMASPLGAITLEVENDTLTSLRIETHPAQPTTPPTHPVLANAVAQLEEYFQGSRTTFDLPLRTQGTAFQEKIWHVLKQIPFGAHTSYQDLGIRAGVGLAPRAVGGAVGANPIPIIIPCHRVLAANQKITGYSGGAGIATKVTLLDHEKISYR